jgi:hypothetical protein
VGREEIAAICFDAVASRCGGEGDARPESLSGTPLEIEAAQGFLALLRNDSSRSVAVVTGALVVWKG